MAWTKEERRAYTKAYNEKNREKVRAAQAEWRERNRDKLNAYQRERYRKRTAAEVRV